MSHKPMRFRGRRFARLAHDNGTPHGQKVNASPIGWVGRPPHIIVDIDPYSRAITAFSIILKKPDGEPGLTLKSSLHVPPGKGHSAARRS
jgi:hypothetical protein